MSVAARDGAIIADPAFRIPGDVPWAPRRERMYVMSFLKNKNKNKNRHKLKTSQAQRRHCGTGRRRHQTKPIDILFMRNQKHLPLGKQGTHLMVTGGGLHKWWLKLVG